MKKYLDPATEQALDWLVQFSADKHNPSLQSRFEQWRTASHSNQEAWLRVSSRLDGMFANIRELDSRAPGQAGEVRRTLLQTPQRRRLLGKFLGLAGIVAGAGILIERSQPFESWFADVHTATGERRVIGLADGSSLILNARSAADILIDDDYRRIRLRRGALIAEVAADPGRPFIVETRFGSVRALGTRFMVREDAHSAYVNVLEHAVSVRNSGGAMIDVSAGQGVLFDQASIGILQANQDDQAAWCDGWITLQDAPLLTLVEALRPYLKAYLRISDKAAQIRVQGVFSLDQPWRTLAALQETHADLEVRHLGDVLIVIEHR
jgi:transmembrane sensor